MTKSVSDLQAEEKDGRLQMHQPCSNATLSLIRSGISASKHCTRAIRKFYEERKNL